MHDGVVEELCRQGRRNAGGVFLAFRNCNRLRAAGRATVEVDILCWDCQWRCKCWPSNCLIRSRGSRKIEKIFRSPYRFEVR